MRVTDRFRSRRVRGWALALMVPVLASCGVAPEPRGAEGTQSPDECSIVDTASANETTGTDSSDSTCGQGQETIRVQDTGRPTVDDNASLSGSQDEQPTDVLPPDTAVIADGQPAHDEEEQPAESASDHDDQRVDNEDGQPDEFDPDHFLAALCGDDPTPECVAIVPDLIEKATVNPSQENVDPHATSGPVPRVVVDDPNAWTPPEIPKVPASVTDVDLESLRMDRDSFNAGELEVVNGSWLLRAAWVPGETVETDASGPGTVTIRVLDENEINGLGLQKVALYVEADSVAMENLQTEGSTLRVGISYDTFRRAYGAGWIGRLRIVRFDACWVAAFDRMSPCGIPLEVDFYNDIAAGVISFDVPIDLISPPRPDQDETERPTPPAGGLAIRAGAS